MVYRLHKIHLHKYDNGKQNGNFLKILQKIAKKATPDTGGVSAVTLEPQGGYGATTFFDFLCVTIYIYFFFFFRIINKK